MTLASYIGVPYAPLGRSREAVDCYGLCYVVYRDLLGVKLPRYDDDYSDPDDADDVAVCIEKNKGNWQ